MSLTKYDGGSAYPFGVNYPGLSIRDWFAGQVLAGLKANKIYSQDSEEMLAAQAYAMANAMIKQKRSIENGEKE